MDDHRYDDIINLPHHVSSKRPHMSLADRAAQFSPFAALTGHAAVIKETVRLTDEQIELTEEAKSILDSKIQILLAALPSSPQVSITYFKPDDRKAGGEYITHTGVARKIEELSHEIVMADGLVIPIDSILKIDGAIFPDIE